MSENGWIEERMVGALIELDLRKSEYPFIVARSSSFCLDTVSSERVHSRNTKPSDSIAKSLCLVLGGSELDWFERSLERDWNWTVVKDRLWMVFQNKKKSWSTVFARGWLIVIRLWFPLDCSLSSLLQSVCGDVSCWVDLNILQNKAETELRWRSTLCESLHSWGWRYGREKLKYQRPMNGSQALISILA